MRVWDLEMEEREDEGLRLMKIEAEEKEDEW